MSCIPEIHYCITFFLRYQKTWPQNVWQLAPKWAGYSSSTLNVFFSSCSTESSDITCMKRDFWNDGVSACLQLRRIRLLMVVTKDWNGRVQIMCSIGRRGVKKIGCGRRWQWQVCVPKSKGSSGVRCRSGGVRWSSRSLRCPQDDDGKLHLWVRCIFDIQVHLEKWDWFYLLFYIVKYWII